MNEYAVYAITNAITAKRYVGFTKRGIERRLAAHFYEASVHKYEMYLHRSMRKHGRDAFSIEAIFSNLTYEEACRLEIETVSSLNTLEPNGYNEHRGGAGGCKDASPELRAKLSRAKLGRSSPLKGKTRAQITAASQARAETKRKQRESEANKTSVLSRPRPLTPDELKAAKSARMKGNKLGVGRVISEATREKLRAKMMGHRPWNTGKAVLSPAQRQHLSECAKARTPWNKGLKGCQTPWNKGLSASSRSRMSNG